MSQVIEHYKEISMEDALKLPFEDFHHAAHVMLYAAWPGSLCGKYPFKYAIMMQLRFDGTLGFPGGLVDKGETPEHAATRELAEEVGGELSVEEADHVRSDWSEKTGFCLHFYAKQLTMKQFQEMEQGVMKAKDWAYEVMGVVRCPLATLPNGLGFPAFLSNNFIGNSREQLIEGIRKCGLLTDQEIRGALERSKTVNLVVSKDEIDY